MQQQGVEQSNDNQRRNTFYLPKDVICPDHQSQKIEWLDLSKNCGRRLYCIQCTRPQKELIFKYDDIYKQIQLDQGRINSNEYATELEKVKKIFYSQLQSIENMLQELHNFYQECFKPDLLHKFVQPFAELNYQQLHELSESLSKQLILKNDQFQFIPDLSAEHKEKLKKIEKCIKLYQNCQISIDKIGSFKEKSILDFVLCRTLKPQKYDYEIITANYELAIDKDFPFGVSAIDLNWHLSYIAIASIQTNHEIQIWDIDKQNMKLTKLLTSLRGHGSLLIQLKICGDSILSIDSNSKMIIWAKQGANRIWQLGRQLQGQMQQINCIEYHFYDNLLAIGGEYLKLWKFNNSDQISQINLIEENFLQKQAQITCLNFNNNRQKLVAGSSNGKIYIFEEINQNWQFSYDLQSSEQSVRHIGFISQNNFIQFSLKNLWTKWEFFTETGYDYSEIQVDNMDNALFVGDLIPIECFPGINNRLQQQLMNHGRILVTWINNNIRIYVLCA